MHFYLYYFCIFALTLFYIIYIQGYVVKYLCFYFLMQHRKEFCKYFHWVIKNILSNL